MNKGIFTSNPKILTNNLLIYTGDDKVLSSSGVIFVLTYSIAVVLDD